MPATYASVLTKATVCPIDAIHTVAYGGGETMKLISIGTFVVLMVIAIVHAAWAFGLTWPGHDKQSLINTVIGQPGLTQMPSMSMTLVVATLIATAGAIALWGGDYFSLPMPNWIRLAGLSGLAAIFFLRGLVTYVPGSPFAKASEPFGTLNIWFYSPLCLLIGAAFVLIFLSRIAQVKQ